MSILLQRELSQSRCSLENSVMVKVKKEQDLTPLRNKLQGERSAIKEVVVLQPHLGLACPQPSLHIQ